MNLPGDHVSDESLLLLDSGELEPHAERTAAEHLKVCEPCRRRYVEYAEVLAATGQVLRSDRERQFLSKLGSLSGAARRPRRRIAQPALAASSAVALLTLGAFLLHTMAEPLSATELLSRAAAEQAGAVPLTRISIHAGSNDCSLSIRFTASDPRRTTTCARLQSALDTVRWDARNPLSATSFRSWRASLADKQDHVWSQGDSLVLRTSTTAGVLRAANLQVRKSDFRPVAARLEFEGLDAVEIVGVPAPVLLASNEPVATAGPAPIPPAAGMRPVERLAIVHGTPLDDAEIVTYLRVHDLSADSGFETVVSRREDKIEIYGLVRDDNRAAQLTQALSSLPLVDVRIKSYAEFEAGDDAPFPASETGNSLPPLGKAWLKRTLPDLAQRQQFVEGLLTRSRKVLGLAFTIDRLSQRADALRENPRSEQLAAVIASLRQTRLRVAAEIREALQPLLQIPGNCEGPANHDAARTIDSALIRILLASREPSDDLEVEIAKLSSAMSCTPSVP